MNQLERAVLGSRQNAEFDQGLRNLMLSMYNHTASGLAVSGAVAWLTYSSGLLYAMGGLMFVAMFAPLGMIFGTVLQDKIGSKTYVVLLCICSTNGT